MIFKPADSLGSCYKDPGYSVWVKLERANPGASIKDCIALFMVEDAEKKDERRNRTRPSIINH